MGLATLFYASSRWLRKNFGTNEIIRAGFHVRFATRQMEANTKQPSGPGNRRLWVDACYTLRWV